MNTVAGKRIGILGGGQLARMLVLAGTPLGARFVIMDGVADACAGQLAPLIHADWNDREGLARLADQVDVVTFDFENVPAESVAWLAERCTVQPSSRALALSQDRIAEKALFESIGLPVARHAAVDSREDLVRAIEQIGTPAVLKTRRFGYDGKGQFRIRSAADADPAWAALGQAGLKHGLVLEAWVPFDQELSVVAVRAADGSFRCWPLTRNWHIDGVLSMSLAPASVPESLVARARQHALDLATELDYVGAFALELFHVGGEMLGNEMAPRVHNSGHWTIDGAITSQFENHVRAMLGLPLGATEAQGCSLMCNWIGSMPEAAGWLAVADAHWHDYGKASRPGRKVGHVTLHASDRAGLRAKLDQLAAIPGMQERLQPAVEALETGGLA